MAVAVAVAVAVGRAPWVGAGATVAAPCADDAGQVLATCSRLKAWT
jgi:hypothetical protein